MNILVISDFHLDNGDSFGAFQWNETDFIAYIEHIRNYHAIEKVVLNGDIFELLKYQFRDIRNAYPALFNYLRSDDIIYIKGNHDIISNFGTDHYRITNSSGQTIHIEHGHNADWFNGSVFGRFAGRLGFLFLGFFSGSRLVRNIYFRLLSVNESINRIPKKYNTIKYLTYALRLLRENDVVVLGHTHKLESHHTYYMHKKKRYLNCGSCSLGRFEGIVLDTETLGYEFIREAKGAFNEFLLLHNAV